MRPTLALDPALSNAIAGVWVLAWESRPHGGGCLLHGSYASLLDLFFGLGDGVLVLSVGCELVGGKGHVGLVRRGLVDGTLRLSGDLGSVSGYVEVLRLGPT